MEERNPKNNITKIFSIVGVVIGVVATQYFFRAPGLDKQLMTAASEINKTCPIMVDKETRLDNAVSASKNDFQYNYTLINLSREELDLATLERNLKPQLIASVKTTPSMKPFRENEITITYNYKDKNGVFLLSLPIKPEDYK